MNPPPFLLPKRQTFCSRRCVNSQARGRSILYISHKLDEVRALCDRATILRGGKRVDDCEPAKETAQSLAEKMIGRRVDSVRARNAEISSEIRLRVSDLSVRSDELHGTHLQGINLTVNAGEIVGIAGIAGNGQTELMSALSGETGAPEGRNHRDRIKRRHPNAPDGPSPTGCCVHTRRAHRPSRGLGSQPDAE